MYSCLLTLNADILYKVAALCWLQEQTYIWAFVAPAAAALVFNLVVLVRALRVAFAAQSRRNQTLLEDIRADAKSSIILTFLLGVTWSIGFLIRGNVALYAAYAFVALNGSVGIFIFLHTVLLNDSVYSEMMVRLGLRRKTEFGLTLGGDRSMAFRPSKQSQSEKRQVRRRKKPEYVRKVSSGSLPDTSSTASSTSSRHRYDLYRTLEEALSVAWVMMELKPIVYLQSHPSCSPCTGLLKIAILNVTSQVTSDLIRSPPI